MKPAPLHPQQPRSSNSLEPPDPAQRRAIRIRVVYWIDMRTKVEGGPMSGRRPEFVDGIAAEIPTATGNVVDCWAYEDNEDSYWAGRGNVIVTGTLEDA